MLLAPVVGLALALVASLVLLAGRWLVGGTEGPLLPAALAVATLAWTTGGLHLDGLADTADALGSRRPAAAALAVMRRSDVGPMGVSALVLVLLVQTFALAAATSSGVGTESLVLAVVTARVAVVLGCTRGVPAARGDGLGSEVAGTVPPAATFGVVAALVGVAWVVGLADADGGPAQAVLAVTAGVAGAALLLRRAIRRLGGVTGDVLGAGVEVATTLVLVVMAGSPDLASPDWSWLRR
jgi:adenosylcobinamide-GDP ribazoletransferase